MRATKNYDFLPWPLHMYPIGNVSLGTKDTMVSDALRSHANQHVKLVGEWKPARARWPFPFLVPITNRECPNSAGVAPWVRSNPVIERASTQHDFTCRFAYVRGGPEVGRRST